MKEEQREKKVGSQFQRHFGLKSLPLLPNTGILFHSIHSTDPLSLSKERLFFEKDLVTFFQKGGSVTFLKHQQDTVSYGDKQIHENRY